MSIVPPPIETEGSPVSTAADDATATNTDWFNRDAGTFIVHIYRPEGWTSDNSRLFEGRDASGNRILSFFTSDTEIDDRFETTGTDPNTANIDVGSAPGFTKYGMTWGGGDYANTANGQTPLETTYTGDPPDITSFYYGRAAGTSYLNGMIVSFEFYPHKVTSAQLQAETQL